MTSENENINSESKNIIKSMGVWLKNLYIFDAIFDWDNEKNVEPIIKLDYDIPSWFKNYSSSIYDYKNKIDYKMKFNTKNEKVKNEILSLFGNEDKNFAIGKYFHQMAVGPDEIMRSSEKLH